MICVSPQVPLPLKHPSIVPAFPPRSSPSRVVMAIVDVFLGVVKAVVFIYDIVTFPMYQVSETNVHMSMLEEVLYALESLLNSCFSDDAAALGDQVQGQAAFGKGNLTCTSHNRIFTYRHLPCGERIREINCK